MWQVCPFLVVCYNDDLLPITFLGPGTSLRSATQMSSQGLSLGIRPLSQTGRPVSGFLRPGTMGGRPKTIEQAIRTPRSLLTARYGMYRSVVWNECRGERQHFNCPL